MQVGFHTYVTKNLSAINLAIKGGITSDTIINDYGNPLFFFDSFLNDLEIVFNHSRIQHPVDESVKRKCPCIRIFITYPERGYQRNNALVPGIVCSRQGQSAFCNLRLEWPTLLWTTLGFLKIGRYPQFHSS